MDRGDSDRVLVISASAGNEKAVQKKKAEAESAICLENNVYAFFRMTIMNTLYLSIA